MEDILSIRYMVQQDESLKEELYNLVYSQDLRTSYQALWACTHLPPSEKEWLQTKQEELINEVLVCTHSGKRRIFLQLLERQTFTETPRVDFLDFCLERMFSKQEPVAIQCLCIKLAYKLCQPVPELLQEFWMILEMDKGGQSSPAVSTTIRNITKKRMKRSKT